MLDYLYFNHSEKCCRCGKDFREGNHYFRQNSYVDEIYCSDCNESLSSYCFFMEIEYIMINGELRVSTEFFWDDLFEEGFYEIRKADGLFVIMKYSESSDELASFISKCGDESFILSYKNHDVRVMIKEGSACMDKQKIDDIKKWAENTFDEYRCNIVNPKMIRYSDKFFSARDASDFLDYCRKRIIGQDKELKKAVYMVIEYVESVKSGDFSNIRNWCLTAPSGSGKTEFYRTIKDYFRYRKIDIPVFLYDLSNMTPVGYKGDSCDVITNTIISGGSDGPCIFFLDEADKKFAHDFCGENDYNEMAQANILSLIEGAEKINKKSKIDTSKTMFVFLGAFQNIRDDKIRKYRKSDVKRIGFGSEMKNKSEISKRSDELFYDDISVEDMIEYGLMEQLAGRISRVVNFHRISEDDMKQLIKAKVKDISEKNYFDIRIEDDAVDSFLHIAYTPLGIRAIINRVNELVSDILTDTVFDNKYNACWDEIVIRSDNKAEIVKKNYRFSEFLA